MYVLNDGKSLELSFDFSSAFSSVQDRESVLETVRATRLPLRIRWNKDRRPAPIELNFLNDLIHAVRRAGGSLKFQAA